MTMRRGCWWGLHRSAMARRDYRTPRQARFAATRSRRWGHKERVTSSPWDCWRYKRRIPSPGCTPPNREFDAEFVEWNVIPLIVTWVLIAAAEVILRFHFV